MPVIEKHPTCPPIDGSLLLPDTFAFHEQHNADLPFYVWKENGANKITELTFRQFIQACRRVPRVLDSQIDISSRPVVAIVALTDTLVYQTVVAGMINAGVAPFPISPRNTAAAIAHLMKKTSSHVLLSTCTTLGGLMEGVKVEFQNTDPDYEISITEIPTIYQLYPEFSDFPNETDTVMNSTNSYRAAVIKPDDIALYLHSSGSTGFPKPIPKSHRILVEHMATPLLLALRRTSNPRMHTPTMHLPPFHAMGFLLQVYLPLYSCAIVGLFPPVVKRPNMVPPMPSPDVVLNQMRATESNAILILPTYLQTWATDKGAIEFLRTFAFIAYSGGAISPSVSQLMRANGVKLQSAYGATEFGAVAISSTSKSNAEDWDYMEFSSQYNVRWVPQGDGTYECQVLSNEALHLDVNNMPDGEGYATSDLFIPHPTKEHFWKLIGRADDVIIHSSGEKTVPPPMEDIMLNSPDIIMGAVMFGHAHSQPGVLIEPEPKYQIDVSNMEQVAQFRNLIWPIIEEANSVAPAFSKIFKELILITDRNKPLPRAAKGTVQRKAALKAYSEEIEELFATVESVQATESIEPPWVWTKDYVTQWILAQAHDLSLNKAIDLTKNLFEQGFDSLSATVLRRRITGAVQSIETDAGKAALASIHQNLIYSYPTVDSLSARIVELVNSDPSAANSNGQTQIDLMEEMIKKYSFQTQPVSQFRVKSGGKEVILMTGSTGYLGSDVLARLLQNPSIAMVYSVNRPSADKVSISRRHWQRFHDKGLNEELLKSPKLKYIECDYSQDSLGLQDMVYAELQKSVTCIIHIAWRLDFNLSLASFEPHIRGTHNLATLARSSAHGSKVKFIFTSSIGTAQSWDPSLGSYPEELLLDPKYAVGNGYGEGKYVTERMLATSGLNTTSLRIGQITGSRTSGAWATSDWVPIFVKSSIALGALPTAKGVISFLPMDAVTDCIEELATYNKQYPPALNVVHPNVIEWNLMIKYMQAALKDGHGVSLGLMPFKEWFAQLETRGLSATPKDMVDIPAIKIHDFFANLVKGDMLDSPPNAEAFGIAEFSTVKMQEINKSLTSLSPLTQDDVDKWMKYWTAAGLFD